MGYTPPAAAASVRVLQHFNTLTTTTSATFATVTTQDITSQTMQTFYRITIFYDTSGAGATPEYRIQLIGAGTTTFTFIQPPLNAAGAGMCTMYVSSSSSADTTIGHVAGTFQDIASSSAGALANGSERLTLAASGTWIGQTSLVVQHATNQTLNTRKIVIERITV